jgi:hypothetical protein
LKGPDHEKRMVTAVGCHQLLNATFWWRVTATVTKLFNKLPLTILYGSTNPITPHKKHSLFHRISIHVQRSLALTRQRTSDYWLQVRAAGATPLPLLPPLSPLTVKCHGVAVFTSSWTTEHSVKMLTQSSKFYQN